MLKKGFVCLWKWQPTFFELATTLKNLGAKWLSEKKLISHPAYDKHTSHVSKSEDLLQFSLNLCFVTTAAAWNLEEDEDSGIASGSTDGVPFGYTSGGLYYSTDVHLQTLHTLVGIVKLVFI